MNAKELANQAESADQSISGKTADGSAYEISGRAGLPVVVFIHGLGLNRHLWQGFELPLLSHYRVLKYDLFGHGDSAPPPHSPSPLDAPPLSVFSTQLCALLDELQIKQCAMVGFSLGGMINRRFAMDYPDRVTALAIFNSPHKRSAQAQQLAEAGIEQTAKGDLTETINSGIARWFTPEFQTSCPQVIAQTRQWLEANDPLIYARCRQLLATGVDELIKPSPPISCPTLVMTCENDERSTPPMSHAIAAEIDGAQIDVVAHLKHMGLVEEPKKFITPLLEFLNNSV